MFEHQLIEAEWHIYASMKQPSLDQIVACRLDCPKPLYEPVFKLYPWEQTSRKFQSKFNHFTKKKNAFENVVWNIGGLFVPASVR